MEFHRRDAEKPEEYAEKTSLLSPRFLHAFRVSAVGWVSFHRGDAETARRKRGEENIEGFLRVFLRIPASPR
jgi:hypothetical protein